VYVKYATLIDIALLLTQICTQLDATDKRELQTLIYGVQSTLRTPLCRQPSQL